MKFLHFDLPVAQNSNTNKVADDAKTASDEGEESPYMEVVKETNSGISIFPHFPTL